MTHNEIEDADVPTGATIFGWIEEIFDQGIRRSGYPADRWAESYCAEHFRTLGMENVRLEPVTVPGWEPLQWSLQVMVRGEAPVELDCFPVPYSEPVDGLEIELEAYDLGDPSRVQDKASLYDVTLLQLPALSFVGSGSAPSTLDELARRVVDPEGVLSARMHRLPFSIEMHGVLEPSLSAGAAAFIGSLKNYPGDSCEFFVPYDGVVRRLPGVWVSGTDGDWLAEQLAHGTVRVRLTVEANKEPVICHNVVGELPGADDEVVMIGSHHDGPWASAVEDASGVALVLAQAHYWAAQEPHQRPHRLVFVVQAAHMVAALGMAQYIEDHRDELDRVVLEVHLEHAALERVENDDGSAAATRDPVPRWFFTSRIPQLEDAVIEALTTERLHRSMLLAPNAIGDHPTSDGGYYYTEGVPLVNFVTAPDYLFDAMDTLDKVDRGHLVPLTRATIRVIASTSGVSASAMRAADLRNVAG